MHRKQSYPHMHVPLKALSSRAMMRRRVTSPHISENEPTMLSSMSPEERSRADSDTGGQASTVTAVDEEEPGALSSGSDPAGGTADSPLFGSPDKRVQFTIGAISNIPEDEGEIEVVKEPVKEKPRRKRWVEGGGRWRCDWWRGLECMLMSSSS